MDESAAIPESDPYKQNGMAFFHIPFPEFMYLHSDYPTYGNKRDESGCWSVNTGFFSAIKEAGTI